MRESIVDFLIYSKPVLAPILVFIGAYLKIKADLKKHSFDNRVTEFKELINSYKSIKKDIEEELFRVRLQRDDIKKDRDIIYDKLRRAEDMYSKCQEQHEKIEKKFMELSAQFHEHKMECPMYET